MLERIRTVGKIVDYNFFSLADKCLESKYVKFPFYLNGKPLLSDEKNKVPYCCLTLKSAGSMRFRWNEENENRKNFFSSLEFSLTGKKLAALELIHSKDVFSVNSLSELKNFQSEMPLGDGILSSCEDIVPVVTVADCVPIYVYNSKKNVVGMLHSGWKGTGIVKTALKKAFDEYGAKAEDFSVVIGPHIHSCCYTIDRLRAEYFKDTFTEKCVSYDEKLHSNFPYRLSLADANLHVLQECRVPMENIAVCSDCTCCSDVFGSSRRELKDVSNELSVEERSRLFTVMAAFVLW